jgi:hypothetical protein
VTELLEVVWIVTQALDTAEVPHTVGGSLASSFAGEPRASIDADILVDMAPGGIGSAAAYLSGGGATSWG